VENAAYPMAAGEMVMIRMYFCRALAGDLLSAAAVVSDTNQIREDYLHARENRTLAATLGKPRNSASVSSYYSTEERGNDRPAGVLGRPTDVELLALLLWIDARDGTGRGNPSAHSLRDEPSAFSVILVLPAAPQCENYEYERAMAGGVRVSVERKHGGGERGLALHYRRRPGETSPRIQAAQWT
jgi:hypothetical protein